MKYEMKLLTLLLILLIIMPHAVRFLQGNYTVIGEESYLSIRTSSTLIKGDFSLQDTMFQGNRSLPVKLYDLLLGVFILLSNSLIASILLPALLALLTFWLCKNILEKLEVAEHYQFFILLMFILSPLFVSLASISNRLTLISFLIVLEIYLLLQKNWKSRLAYLIGIILSFYNIETAVANVLLITSILLWTKEKKYMLILYSIATLGIIFWYHLPITVTEFNVPYSENHANDFLADLGSITGISTFAVLLMLLGLFNSWNYKKKFYFIYLFAISVIFGAFFFHKMIFFAHLSVSLFAGIALAKFAEVRWKIMSLRNACLLVFFCGLLFSTISNAISIANLPPSKELAQGLSWLNEYTNNNAVIFSSQGYGYLIETLAKRKVVLDDSFQKSKDAELRYNDTYTILHSYKLDQTTSLLRKYDVDYVLLTEEMWTGKVWSRPEQGLMFLLNNKDNFELTFNNSEVKIWEFVGKSINPDK